MGHKLYDVLGVPKNCSGEDLKKAYKKLAIQHHPDKGGDPDKFKEISHAYQILSNDDQRRRYDQLGDENFDRGGMPSMDPSSIFEQFFGGGGMPPFFGGPFGGMFHRNEPAHKTCRNLNHVISINLREAYSGSEKHIKITLHKRCFKCLDTCHACQGKGQINELHRMGPFTNIMTRACSTCKGSGQIAKNNNSCTECNGCGEIKTEQRLDVQIPAGVETGWQKVFTGYGEQPQTPNDTPGNLVLEIMVQPDPFFERRGSDLVYKHRMTLADSICGKIIDIQLFDETIHVNTREWGIVQPGKEYSIPEKGMPNQHKKRGNLIILFSIDYPSRVLTDEQVDLVRRAFNL